ncbi:uncharacterized protein LOC133458032 [Cololabis saira]|uniref:uncharacterized protein LOC133458032 n=1 Tax=Cololabis saira TaxID=129043 RepID=UPI002AD50D2A|nr:uncharacterized protein LOC133458032 [Cololabis saira]
MESGKRLCCQALWAALWLLSICSGVPTTSIDTEVDPPDVYNSLWINSTDIAMETLRTPFVKHMKLGDLQSDDYVNFMIQDINYLVKVTEMLKEMTEKVKSPKNLQEFFKGRYESYKKFAQQMLKQFSLNAVSEIKPIPAMEKYLKDYKDIKDNDKPIFFAVSLLPCSRLWIWLANELDIGYGNAYFIWKKNNMYGNPEKHYKKLLNSYLKTPEDIKRAKEIFHQQMQHEHNFFAAVTAA